jgi:GrpB-like predicted nucleotidyltransferase (UPF0157 family)
MATMGADPRVMEHFASTITRPETERVVQRMRAHFERHGFGRWAVQVVHGPSFIGFIGLNVPTFEAHFTPCVEIGWSLAFDQWRHGYATEGARAALADGFERLGLEEIVSFTTVRNRRSVAVMERLGMRHDSAGDFDHPDLEEGHPKRRHVLYRLARKDWLRTEEPVRIGPYDAAWPGAFEKERHLLASVLKPWLVGSIEHVGSTAVPGLAAKPVIDIMAGVESLDASRAAIQPLEQLDYCYWPYMAEEIHWFCKPSPAHRTHHLHLVPFNGERWRRTLAFRDYLRTHSEVAREYAALKERLAVEFRSNREAYTEAKRPFIDSVVQSALD